MVECLISFFTYRPKSEDITTAISSHTFPGRFFISLTKELKPLFNDSNSRSRLGKTSECASYDPVST